MLRVETQTMNILLAQRGNEFTMALDENGNGKCDNNEPEVRPSMRCGPVHMDPDGNMVFNPMLDVVVTSDDGGEQLHTLQTYLQAFTGGKQLIDQPQVTLPEFKKRTLFQGPGVIRISQRKSTLSL